MKYRLFALLLACLLCVSLAAFAEDTGYDICYEDFMASASSGGKPMVLYTARTISSLSMRSKPDKTSEALGVLLQRLFPTHGSNPGLLHCRQTLYRLSH